MIKIKFLINKLYNLEETDCLHIAIFNYLLLFVFISGDPIFSEKSYISESKIKANILCYRFFNSKLHQPQMKACIVIIALTVFSFHCKKPYNTLPEAVSFTNPLLPTGPDPWVIQKDSFYYYTHTLSNRIEIWKTKNISRLSTAPSKVVFVPPTGARNSYHLWAPELHFLDNKWYLYYTAGPTQEPSQQRIFVLENSSSDPLQGEWVDKGIVKDSLEDLFSIDASILQYNSKNYMIWSSISAENNPHQRLYIAELANPWTLKSRRSLISSPQYDWEKVGGPEKNINEGPEILKNKAGQIFLFYSASPCWSDAYTLGIMALKPGSDPLIASNWVKDSKPVLSTNPGNNSFGPGHNAFFKSPDGTEDWIIYHANSEPNQYCGSSRCPRIQKFTWNDDGTPNLGQPAPIFTKLLRPSGERD